MSTVLSALVRRKYKEARKEHDDARLRKIRDNVGKLFCPERSFGGYRALSSVSKQFSAMGNSSRKRPRAEQTNQDDDVTAIIQLSNCTPPPSGLAWVRVRSNLRTPEGCEVGYFVPYLGESDDRLRSSQNLAIDLVQTSGGEEYDGATDEDENDVSDVENNAPQVEHIGTRRILIYGWERAIKRKTIKSVLDSSNMTISDCAKDLAVVFGIPVESVFSYHETVMQRLRLWAKHEREVEFKETLRRDLAAAARCELSDEASKEIASDSLTMLLCRQCYTFDCMMHGIDPSGPKVVLPDGTRIDTMSNTDKRKIFERCEGIAAGACWRKRYPDKTMADVIKNSNAMLDNGEQKVVDGAVSAFDVSDCRPRPLSSAAKALFAELRKHMGDDFCRISEMLRVIDDSSASIRCFDVGVHAMSEPPLPRPKNPKAVSKKSKLVVPAAEINAMMGGRRLDYSPCNHEGPCSHKVCGCAQMGVNCEKYCSCNHVRVSGDRTHSLGICPRSFRGCNCKSATACFTNQCICFSMRRECDPDLCRSCGASNAPFTQRSCCNVGLRLGSRYRTVVGRSMVHGWGVFAAEEIPKNELIGEYLGEVINQDEAERRGRVYDALNYSFLFNITERYAVDSTRLGNKLKYCNHSKTPNCEPRLMRVGGDVRVGIYSKRSIGLFEELFFDYGYHNGPAWAMSGKVPPDSQDDRSSGGVGGRADKRRKGSTMKAVAHTSAKRIITTHGSLRSPRNAMASSPPGLQSSDGTVMQIDPDVVVVVDGNRSAKPSWASDDDVQQDDSEKESNLIANDDDVIDLVSL